jgi:hypothetical protein
VGNIKGDLEIGFGKSAQKFSFLGGKNIKWEIKGKMNAVEGRTQ